MAGIRKKIGEILIEEKLITEEQLSEALETQRLTGQKVGQILVDKGFIKEYESLFYISDNPFDIIKYLETNR